MGLSWQKWNLYNGPRDKDIHDASKFPTLENCRVDTLVSWYQSLQPRLASYCIGLTPFDGIELSFGYQGLCIPGLGIKRYRPMALALYEILITKLPREHQTLLGLFDVGTKDAYHLFWSFFCLTLPIFNTDMELKYPKFADHSGDVEQFARATVIYNKFERMDGRNMNQRHKVMKYLTTLSKAVDWPIVHVKLDCVSRCPGDLSLPVDSQYGTLPPSLSLAQVTADIMQYLRNRQHDPTLGNVDTYRRTNMLEAQLVNKGTVWKEDAKPMDFHMQGYEDLYETDISVFDPVANAVQRRSFPRKSTAPERARVRAPPVACDACGGNHKAIICFWLARALRIQDFIKDPRNKRRIDEAIQYWKDKRAAQVEHKGPERDPKRILAAYVDTFGLSPEQVAEEMDMEEILESVKDE
jgi:hypothetical protein